MSVIPGNDQIARASIDRIYANHNVRVEIEVHGMDAALTELFAETLRQECNEALWRFRVGMSAITVMGADYQAATVKVR